MRLRVQVAADGDARLRLCVEQPLDEEPGLQRLPLPFQARQIIGLRPVRQAAPAPILPPAGQKSRARRPQMRVDQMQGRLTRRVDAGVEEGAVEGEGQGLAAMQRAPFYWRNEIVVDLSMGRDGPAAEDRQIVNIRRPRPAGPRAVNEVKPSAGAALHELSQGEE